MASITVRNLEDEVKTKLRLQAARHGRSMEAEVREIIRDGVMTEEAEPVPERSIADFFRELNERYPPDEDEEDYDLMDYIPPREPMREPPTFD